MIRRSPPIDMPATPMSQPLMTSPDPSVNVKGVPFLFAERYNFSVVIQGKTLQMAYHQKLSRLEACQCISY